MANEDINKEALFNEVKGSLFEYLVGKEIAVRSGDELSFQKSLDQNYLTVLAQQDRMVRQFYPELMSFLHQVSKLTVDDLAAYFDRPLTSPRLLGKLVNSSVGSIIREADLSLTTGEIERFISLKLNKKNAYVNTKSGGIKSFFIQYFPFCQPAFQGMFNNFFELEYERMAAELHDYQDINFPGNFSQWIKEGRPELPGELSAGEKEILRSYYSRVAREMHRILTELYAENPEGFRNGLEVLMGFGQTEVVQVICFHDMKAYGAPSTHIHELNRKKLRDAKILPFNDVSSVEIECGDEILQIRVKPMNKFTTSAVKINCSVKF